MGQTTETIMGMKIVNELINSCGVYGTQLLLAWRAPQHRLSFTFQRPKLTLPVVLSVP